MILGIFYQGSGLGNQLHRYVATRVRAKDLNVPWDMMYIPDGSSKKDGFKGESFMDISWGDTPKLFNEMDSWNEKKVRENGIDVSSYDPEFFFIKDNTIIDGEFQDERYWEHLEKEVDEWLKVEPIETADNICMIGFRGGEFALYPDLFLTKEYYEEAMDIMVKEHGVKGFIVHTDDERLAKEFFGDIPIIHDIGINWRSMRYAKHAIIANSSFFILPRWLRNGVTIAPRFWGRRNVKIWSMAQNYYKRFKYI